MATNTVHIKTKFLDEEAEVVFASYGNGETAVLLVDATDGSPLATATINLDAYDIHPSEGNIIVKDYNENAGMVEGLIRAGVVEKVVQRFSFGAVADGAAECTLTSEYIN